MLALVTGLAAGVVLAALAGARRMDTAVPRFLSYAGPVEGEVIADPPTTARVAGLPDVAHAARSSFMLVIPATPDGRPAVRPGLVVSWALIDGPAQRVLVLAGHLPAASDAGQVALNERAARVLRAGIGSFIRLRGYSPAELAPVMNGSMLRPSVPLPGVRVAAIVRSPSDLGNRDVPPDVTYLGSGSVYLTSAFYQRFAASVGHEDALLFHLKRGRAGVTAFDAEVRRISGGQAQVLTGNDDATAAAAAQRATTVQSLALLLFALLLALALLVIMGQNLARLIATSAGDFPVLRALGASRRQRFAAALTPGALVAVTGMLLAVPVAYGLSAFMPIGLARQAEISPGTSFDAVIVPAGAVGLGLLLTGWAALTAARVARAGDGTSSYAGTARDPAAARWLGRHQFPVTVVTGVRFAFGSGRGRQAVPVRSATLGVAVAVASVTASLVFAASLERVITDPVVAGWNWDVTVGNPHSGDISRVSEARLGQNPDVTGFTATAQGEILLDGRDLALVAMQPVRGQVGLPLLAGRLPRTSGEIAVGGRDLTALHKRVGDTVTARGPHAARTLRIVGQVVLSPEIDNEDVALGHGTVMTLPGARVLGRAPLDVNLFLVRLRPSAGPAAVERLKQSFPGAVLPPIPPSEIRNVQEVSSLPVLLAIVLTVLAVSIVIHTLTTSVRRRRADLAVLKVLGFTGRQVRLTVGWQATTMAGASLLIGLPLGLVLGRLAWLAFARGFAIEPVPVVSPFVLLAVPALLLLANVVAAAPGRAAARTRPAVTLRSE
jgi:ABC-type lipoprotein release transport system permease subunit